MVSLYQPIVESLVVCHCWEAAKPGRVRVSWVAVGCHKHLRNLDQTAQPSACYGSAMIQLFEDVLKGLEFCNFHGGPLQAHMSHSFDPISLIFFSALGKVAVIHEGSCAFRGALRMSMNCMRTSLI